MTFDIGFWKVPLAAGAFAVAASLSATAAAAECGRVTIANMNWASAELVVSA